MPLGIPLLLQSRSWVTQHLQKEEKTLLAPMNAENTEMKLGQRGKQSYPIAE